MINKIEEIFEDIELTLDVKFVENGETITLNDQ